MTTAQQELQNWYDRTMPREARWAYWQDGDGPMFVYNTERIKTRNPDDVANGKFESAVFVPDGDTWRVVDDSRTLHALRRDAKARALRLYIAWTDGEKAPWR